MLRRRSRPEPAPEGAAERPHVAQYRQLLRVATVAELEHLHRGALATLDPFVRANVLRTALDRLPAGGDLTVDDTPQLARLLATAESRTPGIVVSALHVAALDRLATAVLRDELAQRLLARPAPSVHGGGPRTDAGSADAYPSTDSVVVNDTSGA